MAVLRSGRSRRPRLGRLLVSVALALPVAADDEDPSRSSSVVARWAKCELLNRRFWNETRAQLDAVEAYTADDAVLEAVGCEWPFCNDAKMYEYDRCFAPRSYCAIRVVAHESKTPYAVLSSSPRAATAAHPPGAPLEAGRYVVFIGAANSIGTIVPDPLDEQLAAANVTVVNLGKGGSGPGMYLRSWGALEPLVVNAAAVVVHAMALRSTENDACDASFQAVERARVWEEALKAGEYERARAMEAQSFANAIPQYVELLRRIDESRARVDGAFPKAAGGFPRKILLWQSRCDPAVGCALGYYFPQWFTSKERIDALFGLDGWDTVLDANYADAGTEDAGDFAATVAIDQCVDGPGSDDANACDPPPEPAAAADGLTTERIHTCHHDKARADARASNDGCTTKCAYVRQQYYPIDLGHNRSYAVLLPVVRTALADYEAASSSSSSSRRR